VAPLPGSEEEEGVTLALLWGQLQLTAVALVAASVISPFLVKKEVSGTTEVN